MPTTCYYFIGWRIDIWGGREWYDGGKRDGYDTSLELTNAFLFDDKKEALEVAKGFGSRPVFKVGLGRFLPSHPEIWMLEEGKEPEILISFLPIGVEAFID